MAALSVTHPTLLDLARASDPNGKVMPVIEIMNETNDILDDMVWMEGNLPTGHLTSVRTGLPAPTWRKLYGGVQPTKGTTAQVTDTTGELVAYAEVDKKLVDINSNRAAYRELAVRGHIEGMVQELADTIFYGNQGTEPEAFTGLAPRFNVRSGTANSENVIHGGSSDTDNGSIWLIVWGQDKVHGIVPKNMPTGIQIDEKGLVTIDDANGSNGGRMEAYRTRFELNAGLSVPDWRYVVRICNIDKSALTKDASSGADLPDLMYQAMELVPNLNGRASFYMSRTMRSFVRRQVTNKTKDSTLTIENVGGKMITKFHEVPMARCDALAANEDLVPAS